MDEITSHDNKSVRLFRKLKEKKHRDATGSYMIEGPNLIKEAIENGMDVILAGMVSKIPGTETQRSHIPDTIVESLADKIAYISPDIFNTLTDTVTSQGIIAVVEKRNVDFDGGRNRFVILDELQDPGNVGTILRTAEAADFTGVIAVRGTADIYSPKVVRAAAGSLFRIGIVQADSRVKAVSFAADRGISLYACDSEGGSSYTEVDLRENIGIIIGNEGNGVSDYFIERSERINIPMKKGTESLNASVAAGIIIYESERQQIKENYAG